MKAGCDAITIHVEAVPQPTELLRRIRSAGRKAGLAINPGTPVSRIRPFLPECDLVLVMSVEPGFGGQKFMPQVLDKVRAVEIPVIRGKSDFDRWWNRDRHHRIGRRRRMRCLRRRQCDFR